jgi:hypothetical protein
MISDIFIITSVINTGNKPWSYTNTRSPFTIEKRFEQTLQTIESIRKLNDNTKILLVECSDLNEEMTTILKNKTDYFIQTFSIPEVYSACIESNKKGFGETMKVKIACDFIEQNNIEFNKLFKISGRYFLTSDFSKENYSVNEFTFKMYDNTSGSTVLYSVPYSLFDTYVKNINTCNSYYLNNNPRGLETLLPIFCEPRKNISTLGVAGYVSLLNETGPLHYYVA